MKREVLPAIRRSTLAVLALAYVLAVIGSPVAVRALSETFTATNIVATSTLHSLGTTTSDGLVEAKAQIQVDGPGGTNANVRTCNGNPNESVLGTKGSICLDPVTPAIWVNTSGLTTWIQIGPVFTAAAGGSVPASGGLANTFLNGAGAWTDPIAPISFGFGWFSDGSDGNLVFDGSSTVTLLGGTTIVPSGGVYTLPRNIHAHNLTINVGADVRVNGYLVFANGLATINGTLEWNGKDAAGNTGGGTWADNFYSFGGLGGANGAASASTGGNTSAGTGNAAVGCTTGGTSGTTGAGVNGGTCQGGAGGGGGASGGTGGGTGNITILAPQDGDLHDPFMPLFRGGSYYSAQGLSSNRWIVGTGGGGGACGTPGTCQAGAGGGTGGMVMAFLHDVAGSGSIAAHGGAGSTADTQGGQTCPAGGGGGGSGGMITLYYVNGTVPTINLNGGSGGSGANGGTNGGNGGLGLQFIYKLQ